MAAPELADLLSARAAGRVCAVAIEIQRDLSRCVARYPALLPLNIFDASMLSAVALANAFAAPGLAAAGHRMVGRTALWTFALDRWVDGQGASAAEVGALTRDLLDLVRRPRGAVGPDPTPGPTAGLARMLLEIRDGLAGAPGYPVHRRLWRAELRRMLEAMGRERTWIESARPPSVRSYLGNSDSLAFSFVFATQLASVGTPPGVVAAVRRLVRAARVAQRALRLANDLATHERDARLGDLNVLALGLSRDAALAEIDRLARSCREHLLPLRATLPGLSRLVQRQLSYNLSFYAVGDYWGVDPVGGRAP